MEGPILGGPQMKWGKDFASGLRWQRISQWRRAVIWAAAQNRMFCGCCITGHLESMARKYTWWGSWNSHHQQHWKESCAPPVSRWHWRGEAIAGEEESSMRVGVWVCSHHTGSWLLGKSLQRISKNTWLGGGSSGKLPVWAATMKHHKLSG